MPHQNPRLTVHSKRELVPVHQDDHRGASVLQSTTKNLNPLELKTKFSTSDKHSYEVSQKTPASMTSRESALQQRKEELKLEMFNEDNEMPLFPVLVRRGVGTTHHHTHREPMIKR